MDHASETDEEYGACHSCDDVEVIGTMANNDNDIEVWKEKLQHYRRRFDTDELGPYDIVVVVTGTNDLKIMLCPCLIMEQDRELRRRQPGGGFIEDLQALIQNLNERMKRGMRNFSERATRVSRRIRGNTEEFESLLDAGAVDSQAPVPETRKSALSEEALTLDSDESERNGTSSSRTPLFVLPAMPIRTSPSVRAVPLRWLTIPVFDQMEKKKRKLANANPGEILWVKDPSLQDVIEYEEQRGSLWEQRCQEEVLLSLRYIGGGDCGGIAEAMKKYYQNKSVSFDTVNDPTPLCERAGKPGTRVYCADRIHPNEAGYECWARCIANAIVADMKKRKQH
jgi:hypothetical protein